jgi:hypothetical protein
MSRIRYIVFLMKNQSIFLKLIKCAVPWLLWMGLLSGCCTLQSSVKVTSPTREHQNTNTISSSTSSNQSVDTTSPGSITLKWRTESEQENYGFYLYRGLSKDGPWIKVNENIIPGHGTTSEPHDYRYVDNGVRKNTTYYYQLEEVDFKGNASRKPYTIKGIDTKLGVMDKKDK